MIWIIEPRATLATTTGRPGVQELHDDVRRHWGGMAIRGTMVPFLTSLSVHAAMLIAGVMTFRAIQIVRSQPSEEMLPTSTVIYPSPMTISPVSPLPVMDFKDGSSDAKRGDLGDLTGDPQVPMVPRRAPVAASGDGTPVIGPGSLRPGRIGTPGVEAGDLGDLPFGPGNHGPGGGSRAFRPAPAARRVVYLCDASGSMLPKFAVLKRELEKSLSSLRATQAFDVIFFQDAAPKSASRELQIASPDHKRQAVQFINDVACGGTTDPLPGLEMAFGRRPDLVYLLTDGDFPDNAAVLAKVRELNRRNVTRINTIAYVSNEDKDTAFIAVLKQIAQETAGEFRRVRLEDLEQ